MAKAKKKAKAKAKAKVKRKKLATPGLPAAVRITSPSCGDTLAHTMFPFSINVSGFFRITKSTDIVVRVATESNDVEIAHYSVTASGSTWTTTVSVSAAGVYVIDAYDSTALSAYPIADTIILTVT